MYSIVQPFLLHAVTSVHAGSGSEIGLVDLPIQREKHTGFPKIESSSLKGALRYHMKLSANGNKNEEKKLEMIFGGEKSNENNTLASATALSDARILLFPVKSMRGVFAWITCPQVIQRWNSEMSMHKKDALTLPVPKENTCSATKLLVGKSELVLEEYTFSVQVDDDTKAIAQQIEQWLGAHVSIPVVDRLVVLSDDDFADFVQLSTEVNARIKINDETGTVDEGALWYEENVPPETIFYSFLYIGNPRKKDEQLQDAEHIRAYLIDEHKFPEVFQLGGNSTLGRGMMRTVWLGV
ncbi:type III-B CRISPR module RAMP protein Cmr4 [Anoxybacillus ayderensis]|uniref:type III-B CRISPR module RAMP protein Cmr4 n=1 Tax=Anoxybacillus ayderensis TaxID=265546 RepID=UPI000A26EDC1|nr:type III-B CRISPR module RAMP protein Cmr4 [Anoxybacillus ayderensis]OSX55326.1 type III-B CRISPR module RAMP protein Cmr4 [Anoxybacillus ayderensis]